MKLFHFFHHLTKLHLVSLIWFDLNNYFGVHLASKEIELETQVQILDGAVCISLHANAHVKGLNPSVPTSAVGKIFGQTGFFSFG